jgi:hypothetical protein
MIVNNIPKANLLIIIIDVWSINSFSISDISCSTAL